MPCTDFPPELWLEVLSYLPPSYVVNLVGVNRFLFELALDYKYEELQLISCEQRDLNNFQRLHYPCISQRVQSLLIRPAFLPTLDDPNPPRVKWSSRLPWLKKLRLSSSSDDGDESQEPPQDDTVTKILQRATKDLSKCQNLQEVKIIINDCTVTEGFQHLLATLWVTLGSGLQKLCFQTTHPNVPVLLGSVAKHHERLPNLSFFELTLMHSRQQMSVEDAEQTTKSIVGLLTSLQDSLASFTLASLISYDLSTLFERVQTLHRLKTFEVVFVMCDVTLSRRGSLVEFLHKQRHTLQHFVLCPRPRYEFFFPYASNIGLFLNQELQEVHFPKLTTFHVRQPSLPPTLVPSVMPSLRHLIIDHDTPLELETLRLVLDATDGVLEGLDVCVRDLSAETFDLLAKQSPNLQRLTVSFSAVGIYVEYDKTIQQIMSRRYPSWPLEYVRMGAERGSCGEIHPRLSLMDAVAQTVPKMVTKDVEYRCLCMRWNCPSPSF